MISKAIFMFAMFASTISMAQPRGFDPFDTDDVFIQNESQAPAGDGEYVFIQNESQAPAGDGEYVFIQND